MENMNQRSSIKPSNSSSIKDVKNVLNKNVGDAPFVRPSGRIYGPMSSICLITGWWPCGGVGRLVSPESIPAPSFPVPTSQHLYLLAFPELWQTGSLVSGSSKWPSSLLTARRLPGENVQSKRTSQVSDRLPSRAPPRPPTPRQRGTALEIHHRHPRGPEAALKNVHAKTARLMAQGRAFEEGTGALGTTQQDVQGACSTLWEFASPLQSSMSECVAARTVCTKCKARDEYSRSAGRREAR